MCTRKESGTSTDPGRILDGSWTDPGSDLDRIMRAIVGGRRVLERFPGLKSSAPDAFLNIDMAASILLISTTSSHRK